jgi:DNA-binding MarR family transcriptional regulator
MAMWAHCMRFVPPDGVPVGELTRRSGLAGQSMQTVLKRMSQWWGYLTVAPDPADGRAKPPRSAWLARPTTAGRQAQDVWEPLTAVIEDRWRERFGAGESERLRAALHRVVSRFDVAMPDFLPVGEPRLGPGPLGGEDAGLALPALMSKVLLAAALDFDAGSDLSLSQYTASGADRLAVSANVLRVLDERGVRAADIPGLTGVAKMTVDNWLGALEGHGYLTARPGRDGGRFKVATLTAKGCEAQDVYRRWTAALDERWQARCGEQAVSELHGAAGPLRDEARLWQGAEPYSDGWRAAVRRPATLPHYPVISHRGGFPDGS